MCIVTILKWQTWNGQKSELFLKLFSQPSAVMRYMYHSKQPPIVTKLSGDGLRFEHNWDLTLAISCGEDGGGRAYWLLDSIHQCTHVRRWRINRNYVYGWHYVTKFLKDYYQKRTETSRHKKVSKRNLPHVRRDVSMHYGDLYKRLLSVTFNCNCYQLHMHAKCRTQLNSWL